jgi:hypothetical protein
LSARPWATDQTAPPSGEPSRGALSSAGRAAARSTSAGHDLTFITGFFGQSFGWLTGHIQHWGAFVGLGLGTELLAVLVLHGFFKRRGWF